MSSAFGCANWTVQVVARGGGAVRHELAFTTLSTGLTLNQSTSANIDIAASHEFFSACCEMLVDSEPWRDEILLWRDNYLAFAGPMVGLTINQTGGSLFAQNLFHWMEQRFLPDLHADGDVADVFRAIFDAAYEPDTSPNIGISTRQTGVQTVQNYQEVQFHRAADALRTLAEIGIDFTMVGRRILAGGQEVFLTEAPLILHDDAVIDGELSKEGANLATDVAVFGSPARVGGVPANGRATRGTELYGLIQRSFTDLLISDNNSCDLAAQARLEAAQPAPRRLKVTLSPEAAFRFEDTIPGRRVDVRLSNAVGCGRVIDTMRLVDVSVNATVGDSGQTEVVELSLIPLGVTDAE